jgi:hypothetical protein
MLACRYPSRICLGRGSARVVIVIDRPRAGEYRWLDVSVKARPLFQVIVVAAAIRKSGYGAPLHVCGAGGLRLAGGGLPTNQGRPQLAAGIAKTVREITHLIVRRKGLREKKGQEGECAHDLRARAVGGGGRRISARWGNLLIGGGGGGSPSYAQQNETSAAREQHAPQFGTPCRPGSESEAASAARASLYPWPPRWSASSPRRSSGS